MCGLEAFQVFADCESRDWLRGRYESIKERRRGSIRTAPSCTYQGCAQHSVLPEENCNDHNQSLKRTVHVDVIPLTIHSPVDCNMTENMTLSGDGL